MTKYRRDQWVDSFEGQMSILRGHPRGLALVEMMSASAWKEAGRKGVDPIQAANDWSATLDRLRRWKGPKALPVSW